MHVVVVTEKNGKIELTKDELQKMLDEAYQQGKTDGTYQSITTSQWDKFEPYNVYYTTSTALLNFTSEETEQYHKDITKQCDKIGVNIFDLTGR